MGAMKWFLMGVEELINPDKTLEENIKMNKDICDCEGKGNN